MVPYRDPKKVKSSTNVITESQQVVRPSQGYFFNLFSVFTLEAFKISIVISMDCSQAFTCGNWDEPTSQTLHQEMFQPFEWPELGHNACTFVDLKLKCNAGLLCHWTFKARRADHDLTCAHRDINDGVLLALDVNNPQWKCQLTLISGWRVIALTFEPGPGLYAVSSNGTVVAGDFPRCHFELRKVDRTCADAYGQDPDKIEFKFLDTNSKITVECNRMDVPCSWITISHISGSACPDLIKTARAAGARVESPDQILQFSQLAKLHEFWRLSLGASRRSTTGSGR
jgi:hypothetical protein